LLIGTFFALVALLYVFSVFNTLNFIFIFGVNKFFFENTVLFFLFFVGFGVKIPVWPFYYWLTKVHVEASTGFSIFLSGFLVKTAVFCFINVFYLFIDDFVYNVSLSFVV
jgi:NADH-quinone oxidoreductase subunit M